MVGQAIATQEYTDDIVNGKFEENIEAIFFGIKSSGDIYYKLEVPGDPAQMKKSGPYTYNETQYTKLQFTEVSDLYLVISNKTAKAVRIELDFMNVCDPRLTDPRPTYDSSRDFCKRYPEPVLKKTGYYDPGGYPAMGTQICTVIDETIILGNTYCSYEYICYPKGEAYPGIKKNAQVRFDYYCSGYIHDPDNGIEIPGLAQPGEMRPGIVECSNPDGKGTITRTESTCH